MMHEISESDGAVPGDLRLPTQPSPMLAGMIIDVNAGVTLLSLWRNSQLTLERKQFRPTYCIWRPTCRA